MDLNLGHPRIEGKKLFIGGCIYVRSRSASGKTYWDCERVRRGEYKVRAITRQGAAGLVVLEGPEQSAHIHPPDQEASNQRYSVSAIRHRMYLKLSDSWANISSPMQRGLSGCHSSRYKLHLLKANRQSAAHDIIYIIKLEATDPKGRDPHGVFWDGYNNYPEVPESHAGIKEFMSQQIAYIARTMYPTSEMLTQHLKPNCITPSNHKIIDLDHVDMDFGNIPHELVSQNPGDLMSVRDWCIHWVLNAGPNQCTAINVGGHNWNRGMTRFFD
ncbi:hypothetical protein QAD02_016065 [Eretmocerus hayati]|uniref:Uncharacterized protein n=1 Tax=Eretmocerus hayati TaxID=131215 RepID=A0ACC2PAZ5_9HYME|nr:hypothetical protein QAD02_016065 [Eretmocerus hayati]